MSIIKTERKNSWKAKYVASSLLRQKICDAVFKTAYYELGVVKWCWVSQNDEKPKVEVKDLHCMNINSTLKNYRRWKNLGKSVSLLN